MSVEDRPLPVVQRAYFYVVLLVAVHMIVLGVANLLRVGAEIALDAPSGGFTGLPFVFAEFNRPSELYREQASLAIALLLVGVPAWYLHFRAADGAARRSAPERGAALRSTYLHVVIVVSALLVFGYGQRVLRLVLLALVAGDGQSLGVGADRIFQLEPAWEARAAGAFAMAVAAAGALVFHVRVAAADRRSGALAARAAEVGHFAVYALAVVGLLFFAFSVASTLAGLWQRLLFPFPDPVFPPGVTPRPIPGRDASLLFDLANALPGIIAGLALWLAAWLPAQRAVRDAVHDARISIARRFAIYLVVAIAAFVVLFGLTTAIATVLARALGERGITDSDLGRQLGSPLLFAAVFAAVWWYHRRVVEGEATRETEAGRAAAIRRAYYYLIAAIGLAMGAIGAAGAIGAVGSGWLRLMDHDARETATWIALVLVGGPAWAFHWRTSQRRLDDAERRSLQRRVYLYLAILGSVAAVLVFGSAFLFNLLKGVLALRFDLATVHDLWHFGVDSAVGAVALAWHFRLVRADRAALAAAGLEESYHVTLVVRAADRAAAQARVAEALQGQPDITVRG
ncbi:MAG TPA: DUF5671 domain-containing protein [Candidatus Limnocylindria bacterium]|nr:DUF5671 domain-containing protein [Candidatus Limnocylindria bacterium]